MKKTTIFYLGLMLACLAPIQTNANTIMSKGELYKILSDTSMIDQGNLDVETKCLGISREFYISAFKTALDNCWVHVPEQVNLEKSEDLEAMAKCMSDETYTQLDAPKERIDKCFSE